MRRRSALASLLLLPLCACAPKTAASAGPTYTDLDCSKPFAAQAAAITAQPGLADAGEVGAEPYRYFSSADGHTSYLITRPGSPAHPAIVIQRASHGVVTTGCAYGSKKGYDQLLSYLESLKTWTRK